MCVCLFLARWMINIAFILISDLCWIGMFYIRGIIDVLILLCRVEEEQFWNVHVTDQNVLRTFRKFYYISTKLLTIVNISIFFHDTLDISSHCFFWRFPIKSTSKIDLCIGIRIYGFRISFGVAIVVKIEEI